MQKTWNQFLEDTTINRPNISTSCIRRPKTESTLPKNTTKPKKIKKSKVRNKEKTTTVEEADVIFETPPITPISQSPVMRTLPKHVERDQEFWNLYDGGA